jgi:ribosomal protein S6--L-glutamate ligase
MMADSMHIAILSQKPELYSTRRLVAAGEERGHRMSVVNYMQCYMSIASRRPQVLLEGNPLDDVDAIIPRISATTTFYGCAVVRQFEMMGVITGNSSQSVARSRDKLRSLQILSRRGIAMPVTGFAGSTQETQGLIDMVGGAPLIIKLIEGTQGIGVVLAETNKAAESVIDAFRGLNANILVQEFIAESKGSDIRCFVVGGKIVATMMRTAAEGDFRANIHRGGEAVKVKLGPDERATAIAAAKAMGLGIAGVDLIRSNHGTLVLEVNSSPGLEGIEKASGKDVAGRVIEYIEKRASEGEKQDRIGH